jgi:hypothetical protein
VQRESSALLPEDHCLLKGGGLGDGVPPVGEEAGLGEMVPGARDPVAPRSGSLALSHLQWEDFRIQSHRLTGRAPPISLSEFVSVL